MSLDVLMDVAMSTVPENLRACSPVAVKATAGLRLLGPEKSEKILDAVRHRLETSYPFPVVSKEENGVAVMNGSHEGVYAWITTNYLLGKIGGPDHSETAAVFDLGEAPLRSCSNQLSRAHPKGCLRSWRMETTNMNSILVAANSQLYQHSHFGYGLMSARETIHKALIERHPRDKSQ